MKTQRIGAAFALGAALALGATGVLAAGWGDPSTPVLTATASGTAPDCSYTVTASVTGWPGASDPYNIGVELDYWPGGAPGVGQPVFVLGGPDSPQVAIPLTDLNPADVWDTTVASPQDYAYRMELVALGTYQPVGTSPVLTIYLPGAYGGSCGVAATEPPTPTPTVTPLPTSTPTPTAIPTATPTATPKPTAAPTDTPTATPRGDQGVPGGSQGQGQATLPPTGSASSTATPEATATASPTDTPGPTDTPSATAAPNLSPTSSHTGTGGGGGLWLILGIAGFFVVCGGCAFAYLRRRSV